MERGWLALRLARRELRGGLRGFRVFLACLALGVAAIAAAGSTAEAFRQGLAAQAGEILGGDLAVTVRMRLFTPSEKAAFEGAGRTAFAASAQAMAQAPSGARRLVEIRGVSDAYPLAGKVELTGASDVAAALAPAGDAAGAAVEQSLLDRLGLRLGDRFLVGDKTFIARAVLIAEPDRLSRGFGLGPRVLTRLAAAEAGGYFAPGLPFAETARIALPAGVHLDGAKTDVAAKLKRLAPDDSFRISDRTDASPGLKQLIDELEYFLGFIGLASLVAGGLGVQGAVAAHLEAKIPTIALLKVLGADSRLARDVYLIQIAVLAGLGVLVGLAIGAATPLILGAWIGKTLPVPALFQIYPGPLIRAGAFGILAAAAFALPPLARARAAPPAEVFRRAASARPPWGVEMVAAILAAVGLAGLAVATAPTPIAAAIMIAGVVAAFAVLWAVGWSIANLAGRLRGGTRGATRIGLANLAGPGSAARAATPAIGLGVALLSAVVLIQSSLLAQVTEVAPRTAPSLVFSGIPFERAPAFDQALAGILGRPLSSSTYLRAPFATGRIVAVRGQDIETLRIDPGERWAYDSDITLSAIGPEPVKSGVTRGHWWPAGYAGPPLLAVSADVAKGARLEVGDAVTLDVLGRRIETHVAALRKLDLGGFGANFPLVLDPAALAGANLRNVAIAKVSPPEERRIINALAADFPEVNVISVREALGAAAELFDRLALAIRGAAAVAGLAGVLVLVGATTARARVRAREAAQLKVLGASAGYILAVYGVEYGAVGLIAGVAGVGLGALAAWPVVVEVFRATWSVDWAGVASLILGSAGVAAIAGLVAAWAALSRRPAATLREP